jgi:hypothetical protein
MILYRPVGLKELELIAESGWRGFPPRLSHQPIFYPVTTHQYATRICQMWNSKESEAGFAGFVTRFEIDNDFARRYPIQEAAGRECRELWVPAEELAEFNLHILGKIEVVESIYGDGFIGEIDGASNLPIEIAAKLNGR